MEKSSAPAEPPAVRTVDHVDVLKAMADPTRLAILAALMKSRSNRPVMSVKELAAELGEPQTKLYRHVRQLEAAGLIEVASTRMVSGILEQRYRACQQDLKLGRGFLQEHPDEAADVAQTVIDRWRDGFFAAYQRYGAELAPEPYRKPMMVMIDTKVSPAKAAEVRDKLQEIIRDIGDEETEDPQGVSLNLVVGTFIQDPSPIQDPSAPSP